MDRIAVVSTSIPVLPLGGTIACVPAPGGGVSPSNDKSVMEAVLKEALGSLPGTLTASIVPVMGVPSADVDLEALIAVAAHAERLLQEKPPGIVVTTGTDSLEEVAFVLDLLWRHEVPLIITGAMRNTTLPSADGPGNLRDAVLVAGDEQARSAGVLVVMAGEIHQAWQVRKAHTGLVSAFKSSTGGPIGQVQEDTVRIISPSVIDRPRVDLEQQTTNYAVAIVKAALGEDGRTLPQLTKLGYRGAVLEVMGGGSVPHSWVRYLGPLMREIPLVYSPRAGSGPTLLTTYGGIGSELHLRTLGLIPSGLLPPLKARLLLQLLLRRGCTPAHIASAFDMFDQPRSTTHRPSY